MANVQDIVLQIDKELTYKISQLGEYKAVADEVLSAINEMEFNDPEMIRLQELTLRALNIGAKIF